MCTGPKSIALLPYHSILFSLFLFFIIVISYFFVGGGEGLVYILRLFNPRLGEFV